MKLYVASTSEFAGKTLLALALGKIWGARGTTVGYVKPLGKIPVIEGGDMVDEDAAFLAKELGLSGPPDSICPVVITQDIVMGAYRGGTLKLRDGIRKAVEEAAERYDLLLIGGAANLRDGIFLGIAPREVIETFDCRVLLVDKFEGEKSMDQILWAAEILGKRLLGVVINRVSRAQETFVRDTVRPFFETRRIRVFGAVPADPLLDSISVGALAKSLAATVASGETHLGGMIQRFCVGAMDVEHALRVFRRVGHKAVITGGYRADIQLAALETDTVCLILTGGIGPNNLIRTRAQEKGIPILIVQEDTMETVDRFDKIVGRLRIREREKVERGIALVRDHVDTAGLLAALKAAYRARR